ncbi:MAG: hypothetical protein J7L71_06800, partial [Spirochaetaceae bacterium]|nr:hypothetical protein [Spirochaetaceae bacterium]
KNAKKSIDFELRYLGQTVSKLVYRNGPYLTTKKFEKKNKRDFDCEIELDSVPWDSPPAKEFRSFFKNAGKRINSNDNTGNEEHRFESLFLTEFSKKGNKALSYIQPVKIGNIRFPMPTPLSASNHKKTKYSNFHGGGIDLFCRFGKGGVNAKMLVIELKDENDKKEPPLDAIRQAVTYATFLRELLRSNAGADWWKLMGRNNALPDKLTIYAACLMPSNENNDYSFQNNEYSIGEDTIKLHYMYFEEKDNKILNIETSLVP